MHGRMREPVAYLITWTCYGTWLHGDERGSVDPQHNVPGTPTLAPNTRRHAWEGTRCRQPPAELTAAARECVARVIREHCQRRGWPLRALSVRTNHVHLAVEHCGLRPEHMMGQLKAWTARRLREAGLIGAESRPWTRGGSTRYVWESKSINAAIAYVLEGHDVPR